MKKQAHHLFRFSSRFPYDTVPPAVFCAVQSAVYVDKNCLIIRLRIRIRDERAYLTIKGPAGRAGLSRYEFETEIAVTDAQDLLLLCEPGIIDKHRYLVKSPDGEHTWEVDEFHGDNDGLVMAEIELHSEDDTFQKPDFIGQEVTGDRRYYNGHLRANPYKLWGG